MYREIETNVMLAKPTNKRVLRLSFNKSKSWIYLGNLNSPVYHLRYWKYKTYK